MPLHRRRRCRWFAEGPRSPAWVYPDPSDMKNAICAAAIVACVRVLSAQAVDQEVPDVRPELIRSHMRYPSNKTRTDPVVSENTVDVSRPQLARVLAWPTDENCLRASVRGFDQRLQPGRHRRHGPPGQPGTRDELPKRCAPSVIENVRRCDSITAARLAPAG